MNIQDFFNQEKVIDLSFFNFDRLNYNNDVYDV